MKPDPAAAQPTPPPYVRAGEVPRRQAASVYPKAFWPKVAGRNKRQLGNVFGLENFGVNLTSLEPGAETALRHCHSLQDEFVYVLEGTPTLITDAGEFELAPGDCAGFKAATGNAHHLVNRSDQLVTLLEIGNRTKGCRAEYPDDDILMHVEADGRLRFTRKDGSSY